MRRVADRRKPQRDPRDRPVSGLRPFPDPGPFGSWIFRSQAPVAGALGAAAPVIMLDAAGVRRVEITAALRCCVRSRPEAPVRNIHPIAAYLQSRMNARARSGAIMVDDLLTAQPSRMPSRDPYAVGPGAHRSANGASTHIHALEPGCPGHVGMTGDATRPMSHAQGKHAQGTQAQRKQAQGKQAQDRKAQDRKAQGTRAQRAARCAGGGQSFPAGLAARLGRFIPALSMPPCQLWGVNPRRTRHRRRRACPSPQPASGWVRWRDAPS